MLYSTHSKCYKCYIALILLLRTCGLLGTQSVISKCYIALSKYMWAHRANFTMKNKKAELSVKVRRVGGCSGGYRLQYLEILYLLSQRRSLLITLTNWLRVLRTAPFYHLTATF